MPSVRRSVLAVLRDVKVTQETKARLRAHVIARRDAMAPDDRAAASAAIRARLSDLDVVAAARTLLAFAAFGSEVDLDPWLSDRIARGVGVFLPYIERFSPPELQIARVTDLDRDLVPARLGIREPDPQRRRPARADRLDVVIAPGVAFDRAGRRLGYGAGFYDRLLDRLRPGTAVIAVAFSTQIVDAVPEEPHDRRVRTIVTETDTVVPPDPGRQR